MAAEKPVQPAARASLSPAQQFERLVLVIALVGLILTGLPQRYPTEGWAHALFVVGGGIESMRILHRFFALLLFAEVLYHVLTVTYRWYVRRIHFVLFPGLTDVKALARRVRLNFGGKDPEARPNYGFMLKFEWLVIAFSVIVLGVTGLILWNPIAATAALPAASIPTAQSVHSDQALLTIVLLVLLRAGIVLLWKPRRADLYAEAEAAAKTPAPERVASRRRVFLPVALVIAGVAVILLGSYLASDQTAIDTVPRRQAIIFAPDAVPETGDPHIGEVLWGTLRCSFCHGPQGTGGPNGEPDIRRPDLTFEAFFQQVRAGIGDMPAFGEHDLPDGYMVHLWAYLTQPLAPGAEATSSPAQEATEVPSGA
jgi:cytochrome b subunit of formate dehydrogenase/mono/diheme cytochrome c family protein